MAKNETKNETIAETSNEVIAEPKISVEPKKKSFTGLYDKKTYMITLPLTSEKQDDVTVGINGKFYKIKRGEPVEVPAEVYEVLMNSERMDNLAIRRRNALISK